MKFIIQILGSISYALGQWLIIFLLTRLYGAEYAGAYLFLLGVLTPLVIFTNYGVRTSLSTDINNDFDIQDYRALSLIGLLFYIVICIIVLLFYYNDFPFAIIIFSIFFKLSEVLLDPLNGYLIKNKLANIYAISKILRLFISVILFAIFYFLIFQGGIYSIYGFVFSIYVLYYFYDRKKGKEYFNIKPKFNNLIKLLRFNTPIVFTSFLISLNVSVPRFFIADSGLDLLAILGIILSFSSMAVLPISSGSQLLYSKSKIFFEKNNFILNFVVLLYSLTYFIFMYLGLDFLINQIYKISYSFDFWERINISLLGSAQILLVWTNFKVMKDRKFKKAMLLAMSSLIILVISCWLFSLYINPLNSILISILLVTIYTIYLNFIIVRVK